MTERHQPSEVTDLAPNRAERSIGRQHWATIGIFLIALFAALSYAKAFVLPVLLAFLFALTLRPVVRFLARRQIPEFVSAFGLVAALVAALATGFYYLSGPIGTLVTDLPRMGAEIERKISDFRAPVVQLQQATEQIETMAAGENDDPEGPDEVVVREPGLLSEVAANAPDAAARTLFALVLLLFLLASGDLYYTKVVRAMPTLTDKKTALRIAYNIERELSRYLATIFVINVSLGICVGLGLWAVGMPNAALWGALAAVLNFIPYVGSLIGVGLVSVIALGTFPTLAQAAMAPAIYISLTAVEGQLITPTVMGRRLAMNPVAVFLSIAFWGWLWGIIGMLVAVPLMVSIKILCSHIEPLTTFADFLSAELESEPEPEPEPDKVVPTAQG